MKKDSKKMAELWNKFPRLSLQDEEQIVRDALPQFLFYEKKGKTAWCYCTACRRSEVFREHIYADGIEIGGSDVPSKLKHNEYGECPMCGHKVKYKAEGRGHKTLSAWGNYAVSTAIDNALFINAIKVKVSWRDLEEPFVDVEGYRKYIFSEHGSEAKRFTWAEGFVTMKSINEPVFGSFCNSQDSYEYSHLYTLINEWEIEKTFLKYCPFDEYFQAARSVNPILFLKFAAKNPKLTEQLWKCGFRELVEESVTRNSRFDKLINWKCTEIKKALDFNSEEMRYWKSAEDSVRFSDRLYAYMLLKRVKGINSFDERMQIISKDGMELIEKEVALTGKTGATFVKVRNHISKCAGRSKINRYTYAIEWLDCNTMMNTLKYPKESVLRFPKSLSALHNRLVNELNAAESEKQRKEDISYDAKIKEQDKKLAGLMYSNLLYTTILPESMQDIRTEGKVLDHCVASYAERHAKGITHIFFIRKRWKPEERWYTIEVTVDGYIRQCYGYKDNQTIKKPESIKLFEKEYQLFLDHVYKRLTDEEYEKAAMKLADNGGNENGRSNNNQLTA